MTEKARKSNGSGSINQSSLRTTLRGSIDDRKSMISASSGGSNTLCDTRSTKTLTSTCTDQSQVRNFASHVGKIGDAEKRRKQASNAISQSNTLRKSPIAKPMDYEKFCSEKSAQLENDCCRELLVFPRDDIAETEIYSEERTAIPSVSGQQLEQAQWLFTREALKLYSSPFKVISFKYSEFSGDYKKLDCPNVGSLRFELDLLAEESTARSTNQKPSEIVLEGPVTVIPVDASFVDTFRSEKKRYCIVRRYDHSTVFVELQKQPNVPSTHPPVEVKSVESTSKKGKQVLHFYDNPSGEKPVLLLGLDPDIDVADWVININRALKEKEDTQSIGSVPDTGATSNRSAVDSESIGSESSGASLRDSSGAHIWRGKNAVGKALQPPVIDRKNLFALYTDLEPLPLPRGPTCSLLQKTAVKQSRRNLLDPTKSVKVSVTCLDSDDVVSRKKVNIQIHFRELKCGVSFIQGAPEHFEPLFLRIYLFDVASGLRVTEEFKMALVPQHLEKTFRDSLATRLSPLGSPASLHSSTTTVNEIPYSILMHPKANKLICTLSNPEDVFVVVRIERLLSDVPADMYGKTAIDPKHGAKMKKTMAVTCNKLAKYRCSFAWTASPLFTSMTKPGFPSVNGGWQLFKNEGKLTDADLQKLLLDCIKTEKSGKVSPIPNASISIGVNPIHDIVNIPYRISSTLLPLRPWHDEESPKIPVFEMQAFGDAVTEPYSELINLLYVYPINLAYGGQKAFARARNLSVSVRFVSSIQREGSNATCIVDRFNPCGPYLASANTAVQYHEANPHFNDEIKVQLPVVLDPTDHLLFSFTHVSVNNALSPKSDKETVDTPVGFAWLPLARGENFLIMNDDVQEFDLPVSATLSPGYIQYQTLNQVKAQKTADIKWLDSGKPLFRVRLRLVSSVFTTEEKLQAFFQSCQRLYDLRKVKMNGTGPAKETTPASNNRSCSPELDDDLGKEDQLFEKVASKACKLFEVEISRLIPHFHVVLKRLLSLLPMAKSAETATQLLSVTIGIVDCAHTSNYDHILHNFVRFYFSTTTSDDGETTHEAICRHLVMLLEGIRNESRGLSKIFRQLWFFFDIVVKSMAQWLIETQKFKVARRDRFPHDYLMKIENLVAVVVELITKNHSIPESNAANVALGYFLRCCLSLTDRFDIFLRIYHAVEIYDLHAAVDSSTSRQSHIMRSLKLELLQILVGHEHWLPLSLPLLTDRQNSILRSGPTSVFSEPHNNNNLGFISRFFAMFSANPLTMSPAPEPVMDSGERFDSYLDHFWLSENYCQMHFLAGLLIQELMASLREPRDYRPLVICLLRNLLAKHSADVRYTDKASQGRIALLYMPLLQFAIDNIKEIDATARTSMEAPEVPSKAVTTTWSALTVYDVNSAKARQIAQNSAPRPAMQSGTDGEKIMIAPLVEKLTKSEVKDILISILYILSRVPKKTLANVWILQESNNNPNGLVDFLHLLELALQMFSYPGRTYLLKAQTKKKHGMLKANATVNFQFGAERMRPAPVSSYNSDARGTIDSQTSSNTEPPSSATLTMDTVNDDLDNVAPQAFFKECNLTQEMGITVLEIAQSVASEIAVRCNNLSNKPTDMAFNRLLLLYIRLLDESWPESVRLNALAALSIFVSHFAARFFYSGPMEPLSLIIEAMLLQLNSHFQKVQQASAALLQAILRKGYELSLEQKAREAAMDGITSKSKIMQPSRPQKVIREKQKGVELLGRPGAQTSVALARLLGQSNQAIALANSVQFERGLEVLELLINTQAAEKKLSPFENAVMDLITQLKEVISATGALSEAANNPIRKADLHMQLADSYRGSARLRCTWFDTLADIHNDDKWYSEAAVCHAHSMTIIAKELAARGLIKVDWSLLDVINDKIVIEENVYSDSLDAIQPAGFTVDSLTEKVEKLVQVLIQAERYEAVGPVCRLAIPIYEKLNDYKALMGIYLELQQASSRAAEIKASGKRHLGTYYRVVFHSLINFRDEHKSEWIYRERGLTSLAEACENMVFAVQQFVKTKKVQALPENKIDSSGLEDDVAYIQLTHVEPCLKLPNAFRSSAELALEEDEYEVQNNSDPMNYQLHTNVRHFYYEETITDESVPKDAPEMARLSLRRVYLTIQEPFPNTNRRQKVLVRNELTLNPLELACEKLKQKASQIRKLLAAVGIPSRCSQLDQYGIDSAAVSKLDIKGLQLLLQGSVSPTVNVGVLAYAEAFTLAEQKERYGQEGLDRLVLAFKILMTELQDALEVNGKAIGPDQLEYHDMMKKSFTGMLERLKDFFGDQDFILKQTNMLEDSYDAAYVLSSIGGVNL